jgi:hypothetical protein
MIVRARVISADRVDAPATDQVPELPGPRAIRIKLRVLEVWKGARRRSIVVLQSGWLGCPSDARYRKGEVVVAFLHLSNGNFATTGLTYGKLRPSSRALRDYRVQVKAATRLQQKGASPAQRRAWYLETAARAGTRWHGLYELAPQHDPGHWQFDNRDVGDELSSVEKAKIARGFVRNPGSLRTLVFTLDVLRGYRSRSVTRAAFRAIERRLRQGAEMYELRGPMDTLLRRIGVVPIHPSIGRTAIVEQFRAELRKWK